MNKLPAARLARARNYGMNSPSGKYDANGAQTQRFALSGHELLVQIVRCHLRIETGMTSAMPSIRNKSSKSKRVQAMRSSSGRSYGSKSQRSSFPMRRDRVSADKFAGTLEYD